MSVDGISYEFFDLSMTKDLLKITDETDDALLRSTLGLRAERWIKNNLIPYADSFPLVQEEDQETAISAACNHAAAGYKRYNNNFEAAKSFMDDAKEDLNSLVLALKARPTARTKIVAASQSYDTEDDVLFSQRIFR